MNQKKKKAEREHQAEYAAWAAQHAISLEESRINAQRTADRRLAFYEQESARFHMLFVPPATLDQVAANVLTLVNYPQI